LLDAINDTKVVISLQDKIEGIVCNVYNSFNKKAADVYDKVKPALTT
jgi:hypothetical protein